MLGRIRERAGIAVASPRTAGCCADAAVAVEPPAGLPDWVGALAAVVPAQAAALRLAELRGVEVDHPNGLTKVTLTR